MNIQQTAEALLRGLAETLKPLQISPTQYNVLQILKGAGDCGMACCDISERLASRDPDVTRLLDRLEIRDLISRSRHTEDRRVITTRITESGLRVLDSLDVRVLELHRRQLGHLGKAKVRSLIEMLESARARAQ